MDKFKITQKCATTQELTAFGIVIPSTNKNVELEFSESEVNTLTIPDPDTNELMTVHEVIFSVSCVGQIRGGYCTQLIKGMGEASRSDIVAAARAVITAGNE
ncbi:hypothetical protein [Pluralibacter gergoviae]|uniref:hypothetical protein n=1 Tax=Pluralibacter gergoviae TaxID=61647 RepID=UPI00155F1F89|nr:hypothetical protein [Pluralibacter gergoviae]MDU4002737.1 hypothetical protein [Pluralibacter gergoviae]